MALPGGAFEVREYNYRIPCQNLGMGLCRIRILFDCNLAFLEPDVFSYGMRKPLNAIPKDAKPVSHQAVGAERSRDVLSVPLQEVLPRSASQKYCGGPLLRPS